jgi:hypothetical protein
LDVLSCPITFLEIEEKLATKRALSTLIVVSWVGALASLPSEVGVGLAWEALGKVPFFGQAKKELAYVEEQRTGRSDSTVEKTYHSLCFQKSCVTG